MAGIAVATTGTVAVLLASAHLNAEHGPVSGQLVDPNTARMDHLTLALTVLLLILATLDIAFVGAATALDSRTSLAVIQALGSTPAATLGSIATALAVPAALGAAAGLPVGFALFSALENSNTATPVPFVTLASVLVLVVVAAAGTAALAARLNSRRTIAQTLQAAAGLMRSRVVVMPRCRSASRSLLPVHFSVIQVMTEPSRRSASKDSVSRVPAPVGSRTKRQV
jgi:putative ABC transport system permease protein